MRRFMARLQPLALLFLRIALGAVMIAHGYGKVFHGGFGQNTANVVASIGMPAFLGYVVAYLEFIGGMMVLIGVFTRVICAMFVIEMFVAIAKIHFKYGIGTTNGMDLALSCFALAFALVCFGAGLISIDHLIFGGGHKSGA